MNLVARWLHSPARERRTRVDIAARIVAWPVIAASLVMMAIGWTRPEILDDGERPVQTGRMEAALPACDWQTEYEHTLAGLDEDGSRWSLRTGAGGRRGTGACGPSRCW
ncbi:hypothetical protein [Saccharomonospora iraqiensis]|uniref:hypothetical protein n=1 Tax=Saccharomonospora iraqiensis TaxID=52698 RepID=UPI00022DF883|nr:hypothetical protein [Saccharomonospora iraqiensis]